DLPGSTSSAGGTLEITNATVIYTPPAGFTGVDTFVYRVRGLFGGESTAVATVTVLAGADTGATVVSCFRTGPETVQVCLLGAPGQMYLVETSADLQAWGPAGNIVADDTGSINYFYDVGGEPRRFYRFRRP
ncbi:MAG TPA: Ig-like domain-containing protein, partial [Clostridia bacterium]|nr:Ig-like domain-containing protein [Clostridia bacterium]